MTGPVSASTMVRSSRIPLQDVGGGSRSGRGVPSSFKFLGAIRYVNNANNWV